MLAFLLVCGMIDADGACLHEQYPDISPQKLRIAGILASIYHEVVNRRNIAGCRVITEQGRNATPC